jgi:hypothetical protein
MLNDISSLFSKLWEVDQDGKFPAHVKTGEQQMGPDGHLNSMRKDNNDNIQQFHCIN